MPFNQILTLDTFRLRKLQRTLKKINNLKEVMRQLSDEDLAAKTEIFQQRLAAGETLDDLLVEAFAVVREVAYRLLGMFPYDVQVLGAIVLHQGQIAEMKTGEGKTLTATMPLYLNALAGKGAFLITPSSYLAERDYEEMAPIYRFLGLTVSVGVFDTNRKLKSQEKRALYAADIHYTTNSTLGFDYLVHHLAARKEEQFLPAFHYAVLDEIDAVLLDMAQTPLVISGAPRVQSNLYALAKQFVSTLTEGENYYFDPERKEIWLKQSGIDEAERYFHINSLFDIQHKELVRHLVLALRAEKTMQSGKDYLVEDDKIKLLDQTNGRTLEGTKLQGGLHQALEEKEAVEVTEEMRAMASITYQNLFLMFEKLSGMTGTGKTAEDEFIETYNMSVIQIPTHRPVIRKDLPDLIYTTLPEKLTASIALVKKLHATGQPILLVTGSVSMSELYSEILLMEGIPHNLLNAFNAAKEAQIIAEAGRLGNVTVATNMAGRGTDIKLSQEVKALGGLAVICTERMRSKRMDLQVRGRSGRQGDPGVSQFFVSLEDDLVVSFGSSWLQHYFKNARQTVRLETPKPLRKRRFYHHIRHAQEASEADGRSKRQVTLQFDESVRTQRDLVYQERHHLMTGLGKPLDLEALLRQCIQDATKAIPVSDTRAIERFILENISYRFEGVLPRFKTAKGLEEYLLELIFYELEQKKKALSGTDDFEQLVQLAILKAIDEAWVEEVDYLQQLRVLVAGRGTAQRNPIYEYHKSALLAFEEMKQEMRSLILRYLMLSEISYTDKGELEIYFG